MEQFEIAAEANPLNPEPRCEIGNVFLKAGQWEPAVREYDQALQIDPKCVPALLGKARVRLGQGDAETALAEAQRARQHRPDAPAVSAVLGEVLMALGSADEALAQLEQAFRKDTGNADLCYQYAAALELASRVNEAQRAWNRFLEIEPTGARAMLVRNGWVELKRQEFTAWPSPAVSPDGRHVAFPVRAKGIFRAPLEDPGDRALITPCPEGWSQRQLAWSPDGAGLVYSECTAPRESRIRHVPATPGHKPEAIELPCQNPSEPAWSRSGNEILFRDPLNQLWLLDRSNGRTRKLTLTDKAGKRLFAGMANYLPNGKALVVPVTAFPQRTLSLYRVARNTGRVLGKLADLGQVRCGAVSVSEDGATVIAMALGKPSSYLIAVTTTPPFAQAKLCETMYAYDRASWHPEGRTLVFAPPYERVRMLAVVQLGGLDRRPVRIAAKRQDNALSVIATSPAEDAQQVSLRWETFDVNSVRVGAVHESDEPVALKPGEKVEWTIEIPPEDKAKVRTVKVRVLNQDGVGAVKLVDWVEEQ